MNKKRIKSLKIINIMLVIFSFLLLLTPWFMLNSRHFGWGYTAFSYITVPLLFINPLLLLVQLLQLIKVKSKPMYWRVFFAALLIYVVILLFAIN